MFACVARVVCVVVVAALLFAQRPVWSQTVVGTQQAPTAGAAEARPVPPGAPPAGPPGEPSPGGPAPGATPGDEKEKAEAKKKEEEKDKGPPSITRPAAANTPASPNTIKINPDDDGKLRPNFRDQKWVDVLEMLADWSGLALDWTELPGDAVNLTTTKSYTLPEARDTFNRMLLDRGYTMLVQADLGTMSVHNIKNLNPALVPRVSPDELDKHDPYQFVKVSFALSDWLKAEEAAKDFEHMKSANGTLKPLNATNRLEVVDAVSNLRQIRDVLSDSLTYSGNKQRIQVFPIKHRNAADVAEMLYGILGIDSKPKAPGPINPQEMQQIQQQLQQLQQQREQGGGPKPAPQQKPEVHLVVNRPENTIIAHAPPEQMAIIDQAIKQIDVEGLRDRSLTTNLLRMHTYKLASLDPEPFVKILQDIGNLDFTTRLEVDKKNNAIIAFATLADHVTIRSLVDKLDSSGRRFYVVRLRRLRADYVAGTIEFMMGGGEKKEETRRRPYWFFDYGREQQEEDKTNKFSVDADIENNWLLLRANETEMKEIEDLLVQLGEVRVPGTDRSTVRYIEAPPGESTDAMLERIRRIWPSIAPNELFVEPSEAKEEKKPEPTTLKEPKQFTPPKTDTTQMDGGGATGAARRRDTVATGPAAWPPADVPVQLAQLGSGGQEASGARSEDTEQQTEPSANGEQDLLEQFLRSRPNGQSEESPKGDRDATRAPVNVTRGPDGRLIISSSDTRALDLLEELLVQETPPRKNFKIYKLVYADSLEVQTNLEDFFKDGADDSRSRFWSWYWYDDFGNTNNNNSRRLSERAPVKFIADVQSNSIVVQNADPRQLETIDELIRFYDKPEPDDSQTAKRMEFFPLHYANADTVVQRVKEVFIDLLTPNDKARQQNQKEAPAERVYNFNYGDSGELEKTPRFKGQLLISADSDSNTVVVVAPGFVMEPVKAMIQHLDEAARPARTVQVMKLNGMNASQVQQAIAKLVGQQTAAPQAAAEGAESQAEGQQGKPGQQANGQSVTPTRNGQ